MTVRKEGKSVSTMTARRELSIASVVRMSAATQAGFWSAYDPALQSRPKQVTYDTTMQPTAERNQRP